jgi:hypothetical protein
MKSKMTIFSVNSVAGFQLFASVKTSFFVLSETVIEISEIKNKGYGIGLELVEKWNF